MAHDFATLQIHPRELEKIIGTDVSEGFVGGVLGGVYRPSSLRQMAGRLTLVAIELVMAGLLFVFSLPIGLSLLRRSNAGGMRVLMISAVITIVGMIAWNIYMQVQLRRLKRLMVLLDQVDHLNEIIATLLVLSQLGENAIADDPWSDEDHPQSLFTALELTRENLVTALVTEKLLRENQRLFDRQAAFLSHLETNLVTLKTLEINQQAQEYRRVLHEALMINLAVQREMAQLPK